MTRNDYNKMILYRIESSFDKLIPISGLVMLLSSVLIYFSSIPIRFAYTDGLFGILFILMSFFRNKLDIEAKILISISIPIIIGVMSFFDGGFSSSAVTLLIISNIVAVLLLSKKHSLLVSLTSIMILMALGIWSNLISKNTLMNIGAAKWGIQILTFMLYMLMLHKMVYAIKKYLMENIEELEDSVAKTYDLAYFDELTGLPNQIKFKEILSEKTENHNASGALVFLKLKNLNLINSIHGENIGDKVLLETTNVFNSIKSDTEILARIAGNEYALWIENVDLVKERIDILLNQFQKHFHLSYMTKKIEFYVSYAHHNIGESVLRDCYQKCVLALTFAKTHNMTKIVAYDESFDEIIRNEEAIKEQLANAIVLDEFRLFYQAKVDALSGEVVGVEALARWNNHLLGNISPNEFIPVLEKTNQSTEFGEFIIKRAMNEYKGLCEKYHEGIKLAINISPSHLISSGFVDYIRDSIKASGIKANLIILEITEDILIEGIDAVIELIDSLKEIGVNVSIDDFGSGYSSLNYLTKMNIDELKIDKSFVDQIESNKKIGIMLEHLVRLAAEYKLNIIAEGVETKEQCDRLVEIGFTEIQGYYFSRPEPL